LQLTKLRETGSMFQDHRTIVISSSTNSEVQHLLTELSKSSVDNRVIATIRLIN
jgi:hypothetical protein